MMRQFMPIDEMVDGFTKDPIDYWVNSFGGCRSQYVALSLAKKYKIYNRSYEQLGCHCIEPYDVPVKACVFVYIDDVGIAISSQLDRNLRENYSKITNDGRNRTPNVAIWLDLIEEQIENWTTSNIWSPKKPLYLVNADKLGSPESIRKFKKTFGTDILPFSKRKTRSYHESVVRHLPRINKINVQLSNLSNLGDVTNKKTLYQKFIG